MKSLKKRKGFTLVELLVVIAILAILATVSVVGYTAFITRARQSNCDTEAYQVQQAFAAELMVPSGIYVINANSVDDTNYATVYAVKAYEAGNEQSGLLFCQVVDAKGSIDNEAWAPVVGGADLTAAFKANEDFTALTDGGKFEYQIAVSSDAVTAKIVYSYTAYEGVQSDIAIGSFESEKFAGIKAVGDKIKITVDGTEQTTTTANQSVTFPTTATVSETSYTVSWVLLEDGTTDKSSSITNGTWSNPTAGSYIAVGTISDSSKNVIGVKVFEITVSAAAETK